LSSISSNYKHILYSIKTLLKNISFLVTNKIFEQERYFYFRVFRDKYKIYSYWIEPSKSKSKIPIDVIIPVVEKDLATLPHVIIGLRKFMQHPIVNIYIVAPISAAIEACAMQYQCVFVPENTICDTTKSSIGFVINKYDRSGWIYQQLLKLNFDKVGTCENYLVVDADTVFIKNTRFDKQGKFYFDFSDEFHQPYFQSFELLTGLQHHMPISFIAHYMFFNKSKLRSLKALIEKTSGCNIENAIIELKEKVKEYSYFSEYETYANYCLQSFKDEYRIRYWFNKSLPQRNIANIHQIENTNSLYRTYSFHSYNY
jgi:hypothetical protein